MIDNLFESTLSRELSRTSNYSQNTLVPQQTAIRKEKAIIPLGKQEPKAIMTKKWASMESSKTDESVEKDLRFLELRKYASKKQFYKSTGMKEKPKTFQIGTVMEGPGEYFSGRLTKKQRQKTLLDEIKQTRSEKDRLKKPVAKGAPAPRKRRIQKRK
ncbi:putative Fcf2 pre-rRNA processing [Monocercomonoides exilis]|uniref:putative Fcf2 pre-rRNA processing n=1 Tax=Monocercomonoides exilis TaxID=2049356 RepID=UPI0035597431|nr:putative Fcf2 pre-rRNA processing [Monocercomonoides exilis]|eukprot:MONOS_6192.1-p1 / transcript=MONOS_6192.1 / gene=MONOS_6192 / organism=Monocercomonoides_exilis_PA203 / gene_product=unspecified product / transcript_product=unspecified product / location=Mono_scaffold00192:8938-9541(-) / protein_length=157 / sequence_SO=supercontig / SO=protein_coding / is_pseudo=false